MSTGICFCPLIHHVSGESTKLHSDGGTGKTIVWLVRLSVKKVVLASFACYWLGMLLLADASARAGVRFLLFLLLLGCGTCTLKHGTCLSPRTRKVSLDSYIGKKEKKKRDLDWGRRYQSRMLEWLHSSSGDFC